MTRESYIPELLRKKISITSIPASFDRLRIIFDLNYFQVDPKRAHEYLYLQDRSSTKFSVNLLVPIGKKDKIIYAGEVLGGVSDRPIESYQAMLFCDVFKHHPHTPAQGFSVENFLREALPLDQPLPEFGGYKEAFKPGNVILDIASGEAVADIQLAQKFPGVTIIGVDSLYNDERKVYQNRTGLQLTKADWRELRPIPDKSVDVILSVQGIAMWGMPRSGNFNGVADEDGLKVIKAINRVTKLGAIVRMDQKNPFLCEHIGSNWKIASRDDVFIAKKYTE